MVYVGPLARVIPNAPYNIHCRQSFYCFVLFMSPVDPPRWRRSSTIRPWCHHLGELVVRPSAPNNIRPNTPRRHANRHASWHSPSPRRPPTAAGVIAVTSAGPGKTSSKDPLGCLRSPKRAAGGQYRPQATPRGDKRRFLVATVVGERITSPHAVNTIPTPVGVHNAIVHRCSLPRRGHQTVGDLHTLGVAPGSKARGYRVVGLRSHL